jgi:hypothetical protein
MAKINLTDRERYAIFVIINPMSHADRSARRAFDKLWDRLNLDEIASKAEHLNPHVAPPHLSFGNADAIEYDCTSDQRDMLIDKVCGITGLSTMFGRMLNRAEAEMVRAREGRTLEAVESVNG